MENDDAWEEWAQNREDWDRCTNDEEGDGDDD